MERIQTNRSVRAPLYMKLSADLFTPATGKTVVVKISKNGGAFVDPAAGALNATEIGAGWYYADLGSDDTSDDGPLLVRGTAASCVQYTREYTVIEGVLFSGDFDPLETLIDTYTAKVTLTQSQPRVVFDDTVTFSKGIVGNITGSLSGSIGSGTVTLAASQALYAPAKAGDSMALTSSERNSVADALLGRTDGVETGKTPKQALRAALALAAGKVTGAGTGTEIFYAPDGSTARMTFTVDSVGNRTVTVNL